MCTESFGLLTSQRRTFIGTFWSAAFWRAQNASKSFGSGVPWRISARPAAAPPLKKTSLWPNQFSPGAGASRFTSFPAASTTVASMRTNPGRASDVRMWKDPPFAIGSRPASRTPSSPVRVHFTKYAAPAGMSAFVSVRVKSIGSPTA